MPHVGYVRVQGLGFSISGLKGFSKQVINVAI